MSIKWQGKEDNGKITIIAGAEGFTVKSRKQDKENGKLAEEGERRYASWEVIGQVDGGIFGLIGLKSPYSVVLP
jgi:hypothetical protein